MPENSASLPALCATIEVCADTLMPYAPRPHAVFWSTRDRSPNRATLRGRISWGSIVTTRHSRPPPAGMSRTERRTKVATGARTTCKCVRDVRSRHADRQRGSLPIVSPPRRPILLPRVSTPRKGFSKILWVTTLTQLFLITQKKIRSRGVA